MSSGATVNELLSQIPEGFTPDSAPWMDPIPPAPASLDAALSEPWIVPGVPGIRLPLIHPEGSCSLRLCLMGEAGGSNEQKDLKPFRPYAQAGAVLQRALRETGIDRNQCLITNTVWWQPTGNFLSGAPYEFAARDWCRPLNLELFRRHRPQAVLALGATAFYELTGRTEIKVGNGRGFVNWAKPEYAEACGVPRLPVILTYHPSYLARGSGKGREDDELDGAKVGKQEGPGLGLLGVLKRDLRLALDCARGRTPSDLSQDYRWDPPDRDWEELFHLSQSNPDLLISYDYETSLAIYADDETEEVYEIGDVTQVQVAADPSWAIVARWDKEGRTRKWLERFMLLPNTKLDVNGRSFDRKISKNLGLRSNGKFCDLQSMWHHLQPDLPKNLQYITSFFVPQAGQWKQLMGVDMKGYGGHDATMPIRAYHGILHALRGLSHPLTGQSLEASYFRQVLDLELLCLDAYERRGIPVDDERRKTLAREMIGEIEEIKAKVQPLVPESLKPIKQKDGLKEPPAEYLAKFRQRFVELQGLRKKLMAAWKQVRDARKQFGPNHQIPLDAAKTALAEVTAKLAETKLALAQARIDGPEGDRWESEPTAASEEPVVYVKRDFEDGRRWSRLEEFNPNSSQQMLRYLHHKVKEEIEAGVPKTKRVWKVPIKFGTSDETTGKKEIDRLAKITKDPLLLQSLLIRETKKLQGTYVGRPDGSERTCDWHPGPDGLVHPFYSTKPATGQLSSEEPNALNFPKHNKRWYDKIRGLIKAPPGRVVCECVSPETRILTADMKWVRADEIEIGRELVGFDENSIPMGKAKTRTGRKTRRAVVTDRVTIKRPRLRIKTTHGDITVSKSHLFLCRRRSNLGTWTAAEDLRIGDRLSFFTSPWAIDESRDAAWLAGFLDGEGYIGRGGRAGYGQNPGTVSTHARLLLEQRGFQIVTYNNGSRACEGHDIRDGKPFTGWRVVGTFRPLRLLENLATQWEDRSVWGKNTTRAEILDIEDLGEGDVVAIATTTHTLVTEGFLSHNCDYRAFHVLTTGFEAGCEKYMRLARLDMHSFFAATRLCKLYRSDELLKLSDSDLTRCLSELRADPTPRYNGKPFEFVRGKQAKPTILGYGFGEGPARIYNENQEFFESKQAAEFVHRELGEEFPVVKRWQKSVTQEADRLTYLISRYGYIRHFHCVFHKKPLRFGARPAWGATSFYSNGMEWEMRQGDDYEAAMAFRPANDAFGMCRDVYLGLEEDGLGDDLWISIPLHDAIVFFPPANRALEAIQEVRRRMEAPSRCLILPDGTGLRCEVEGMMSKEGGSWAEMEPVRF